MSAINGGTFTAARLGRAGGQFFTAFWLEEYSAPVAVNRNVTPAVGSAAYKDRVFNEQSTATITDFDWPIGYDLDRPTTQAISLTSSNAGVITAPSVPGDRWTAVAAGTATISAVCDANTLSRSVTVTTATTLGRDTFTFASGSAAANATTAVDSRIAGKNPSTTRALFSTLNAATQTYVRNVNFWASDIDLTCIPASDQYLNGCLISSDILACAAHFVPNGTLHFVTADNTVITRSTNSSAFITGDLAIVKLTEALPGTITPAKILPTAYSSRLPIATDAEILAGYPWRVPLLGFNRVRTGFVVDASNTWALAGGSILAQTPVDVTRLSFNTVPVSGDSGSPLFILINSTPVLLCGWLTPSYGTMITNSAALQAAITVLGGQQATEVDLSGFNSY